MTRGLRWTSDAYQALTEVEEDKCDICDEPVAGFLSGCEQCGRMFGPCCDSEDEDCCAMCNPVGHHDNRD